MSFYVVSNQMIEHGKPFGQPIWMPLLHIIGVSPSNTTFSIALCFMQTEQEELYKWALKTFLLWLDPLTSQLPVLCTDRYLALLVQM